MRASSGDAARIAIVRWDLLSATLISSEFDGRPESISRMCDSPSIQSTCNAAVSISLAPDDLMVLMLDLGMDPSGSTSNVSTTEKLPVAGLARPELHSSNILPIRSLIGETLISPNRFACGLFSED